MRPSFLHTAPLVVLFILISALFHATQADGVEKIGDIDGDGRADILWRRYLQFESRTSVWYMDGAVRIGFGNFSPVLKDGVWQLRGMGDWNGDGKWDLLWRKPGTGKNVV